MPPQMGTTAHGSDAAGASATATGDPVLPEWVRAGSDNGDWGEKLEVPEWKDDGGAYRASNGWRGRDLVHDRDSPVRVLDYYVAYGGGIRQDHHSDEKTLYKTFARGGVGTTLTGIVHFTSRAESHKGYCHGGSMCGIMDDVLGWIGFLATGECLPWSGYTVQVNSSLQKPVRVGSFLRVRAEIVGIERRKVSIEATISDPAAERPGLAEGGRDPSIHATATGLTILNRGVLCEDRKG